MSSAKEKAEELVDKFLNEALIDNYEAKRCTLIAVDEVINNLPLITEIQNYWIQVKNEIEKL